jgi:hypothetical protein
MSMNLDSLAGADRAAGTLGRAVAALGLYLSARVRGLWDAYWRYQLRRTTVLMLEALDDRVLEDIGLGAARSGRLCSAATPRVRARTIRAGGSRPTCRLVRLSFVRPQSARRAPAELGESCRDDAPWGRNGSPVAPCPRPSWSTPSTPP